MLTTHLKEVLKSQEYFPWTEFKNNNHMLGFSDASPNDIEHFQRLIDKRFLIDGNSAKYQININVLRAQGIDHEIDHERLNCAMIPVNFMIHTV